MDYVKLFVGVFVLVLSLTLIGASIVARAETCTTSCVDLGGGRTHCSTVCY